MQSKYIKMLTLIFLTIFIIGSYLFYQNQTISSNEVLYIEIETYQLVNNKPQKQVQQLHTLVELEAIVSDKYISQEIIHEVNRLNRHFWRWHKYTGKVDNNYVLLTFYGSMGKPIVQIRLTPDQINKPQYPYGTPVSYFYHDFDINNSPTLKKVWHKHGDKQ